MFVAGKLFGVVCTGQITKTGIYENGTEIFKYLEYLDDILHDFLLKNYKDTRFN